MHFLGKIQVPFLESTETIMEVNALFVVAKIMIHKRIESLSWPLMINKLLYLATVNMLELHR